MGIEKILPMHEQDEINPEKPGDFTDKDGLLHCGVCGKPKQYHVILPGYDKIVPCVCECILKKQEQRKKEEEYREKMQLIRRLKDGSMMAGKFKDSCFEAFIRRPENEAAYNLAINYCDNWQDMKRKNQGILFYGPVGTGKSYTAACIANRLLNESVPVIMTSFVKLLQDIRSADDESDYIAILNSASLLIIDDLGAERNTEYAQEKVYNIIDSRIRANKPMILTTNIDLSEMMNCEDIRYKRIYDRIFEFCFPMEIAGSSFRKNEAAKRFEQMKDFINRRA